MKLIYKGPGFLPSVPARDLTEEEVELHGEKALLASGLYEKEKEPAKKSGKESE